jgi:hypothetical protein
VVLKKHSGSLPFKNPKPEGARWEQGLKPGVDEIYARNTHSTYNFEAD